MDTAVWVVSQIRFVRHLRSDARTREARKQGLPAKPLLVSSVSDVLSATQPSARYVWLATTISRHTPSRSVRPFDD
jgi:hypothetical protein